MEIRMKTLSAGPKGARHPGETCIVSPEEGEMLVAGGYAEALQKPPEVRAVEPPEVRAVEPPEVAVASEDETAKKRRK